jgi:catechol 2,3-dioxygenase-like lactoylglutathione lyase family enzyme
MIGYTMLGTSDPARAKAFYSPVLALLGAHVNTDYSSDFGTWYTVGGGTPMLVITAPHDNKPATAGNGTMVALPASSQDVVNEVYAKALAMGATDEGAPGYRNGPFYGAYFRDPDGNKLCVFKIV